MKEIVLKLITETGNGFTVIVVALVLGLAGALAALLNRRPNKLGHVENMAKLMPTIKRRC